MHCLCMLAVHMLRLCNTEHELSFTFIPIRKISLLLLLCGTDVSSAKPKKWYSACLVSSIENIESNDEVLNKVKAIGGRGNVRAFAYKTGWWLEVGRWELEWSRVWMKGVKEEGNGEEGVQEERSAEQATWMSWRAFYAPFSQSFTILKNIRLEF